MFEYKIKHWSRGDLARSSEDVLINAVAKKGWRVVSVEHLETGLHVCFEKQVARVSIPG